MEKRKLRKSKSKVTKDSLTPYGDNIVKKLGESIESLEPSLNNEKDGPEESKKEDDEYLSEHSDEEQK